MHCYSIGHKAKNRRGASNTAPYFVFIIENTMEIARLTKFGTEQPFV
jgi:hypothetical protein